jgi:hypothetical protein
MANIRRVSDRCKDRIGANNRVRVWLVPRVSLLPPLDSRPSPPSQPPVQDTVPANESCSFPPPQPPAFQYSFFLRTLGNDDQSTFSRSRTALVPSQYNLSFNFTDIFLQFSYPSGAMMTRIPSP